MNLAAAQAQPCLLHDAVDGRIREVLAWIKAGASVNDFDLFDAPALAYVAGSAGRNQMAMIGALLGAGADIDAVSEHEGGQTALMEAARAGQCEVVKLLVEAGANRSAVTGEGRTALHLAVQERQPEVVRYLAREPEIEAKTFRDGNTPLMEAALKNAVRVTGILLANSADTAAKNAKGMTALHLAARNNCTDVGLLLSYSMPEAVTERDSSGKTPVDYAKNFDPEGELYLHLCDILGPN